MFSFKIYLITAVLLVALGTVLSDNTDRIPERIAAAPGGVDASSQNIHPALVYLNTTLSQFMDEYKKIRESELREQCPSGMSTGLLIGFIIAISAAIVVVSVVAIFGFRKNAPVQYVVQQPPSTGL